MCVWLVYLSNLVFIFSDVHDRVCVCFHRYFYRACQGSLFPGAVQVGRQLDKLPAETRRNLLSLSWMKAGSLGSLFGPRPSLFPFSASFPRGCGPRLRQPHPNSSSSSSSSSPSSSSAASTSKKPEAPGGLPDSNSLATWTSCPSSEQTVDQRSVSGGGVPQRDKGRPHKQSSGLPPSSSTFPHPDSIGEPPTPSTDTNTLPYTKEPKRAGAAPPESAPLSDPPAFEEAVVPLSDFRPLSWMTSTPLLSPQTSSNQEGGASSTQGGAQRRDYEAEASPMHRLLPKEGGVHRAQGSDCEKEHALKTTLL